MTLMKPKQKALKSIIVCLAFSLLTVTAGSPVLAEDILVIASKNAPVERLDQKMIQAIFLGKKSIWPDGSQIEFVILDPGNTHKTFLKTYIKKTPSRYKTYWKKRVFTGKGLYPKSFASEKELLAYIAERKGAIGYVSKSTDTTGVKVVSRK